MRPHILYLYNADLDRCFYPNQHNQKYSRAYTCNSIAYHHEDFSVVPLLGLYVLFCSVSQYNEVREVVEFLGRIVCLILNYENLNYENSLYTPHSSLAYALTLFGHTHLESLEAAVRASLADHADLTFFADAVRAQRTELNPDEIHLAYFHAPILCEIKLWLVRCACAPHVDPFSTLADKLKDYTETQPHLSALAPPYRLVSGEYISMPELKRALLGLEDLALASGVSLNDEFREGDAGYLHPVRHDAFHVVREFMRLAMNCSAMCIEFGPKEWNFADGVPELSEDELFISYNVVSDAWSRMLPNPFSDAPLNVRRILARCNVVDIMGYFLVNLEQMSHPYPDLMSINKLADYFVQEVQWAAEDFDYHTFHSFRAIRLRNPFLGPEIPHSSFAQPLNELVATRQPFAQSYEVGGIPWNDTLSPPGLADIEIEANFRRYEHFMNLFYGLDPADFEVATQDSSLVAQQPLLAEDAPVYSGEMELAAPPLLVAVGPLIRASDHSDPINEADLREEDLCLICQDSFLDYIDPAVRLQACNHLIHQDELQLLLNAAYFAQPQVRCGLCRASIWAPRQTMEVVD
ncbi:hypothetical protein PMIN06_000123 [Paraphaeosphaeria minitans]